MPQELDFRGLAGCGVLTKQASEQKKAGIVNYDSR